VNPKKRQLLSPDTISSPLKKREFDVTTQQVRILNRFSVLNDKSNDDDDEEEDVEQDDSMDTVIQADTEHNAIVINDDRDDVLARFLAKAMQHLLLRLHPTRM